MGEAGSSALKSEAVRAARAESAMRWLATFASALCVFAVLCGIALSAGHHPDSAHYQPHETIPLALPSFVSSLVVVVVVGLLLLALSPLVLTFALGLVARKGGRRGARAGIALGITCLALSLGAALVVATVNSVYTLVPVGVLFALGIALSLLSLVAGSVERPTSTPMPRGQTFWAIVSAGVVASSTAAAFAIPEPAAQPQAGVASFPAPPSAPPASSPCLQARELDSFCEPVNALGVSANGQWLATWHAQRVVVWDLKKRNLAWQRPAPPASGDQEILVRDDGASAFASSAAGVLVLDANSDARPVLRCSAGPSDSNRAGAIALSSDGTELAIVHGNVCTVTVGAWGSVHPLGSDCDGASIAYAPGNKQLWVGCAKALHAYALPQGELTHSILVDQGQPAIGSGGWPSPLGFDALGISPDGTRLLSFGLRRVGDGESSPPPLLPGGQRLRDRNAGVWQWDPADGRPLGFAPFSWTTATRAEYGEQPGRVAVMRARAAWFPSFVALSEPVQFFDSHTGESVHPFRDLEGAQLIATSRNARVIAVARYPHPPLGSPTLFVRDQPAY